MLHSPDYDENIFEIRDVLKSMKRSYFLEHSRWLPASNISSIRKIYCNVANTFSTVKYNPNRPDMISTPTTYDNIDRVMSSVTFDIWSIYTYI